MGDEREGGWMGEKDGRLERKMGETNDGCERKTVWGGTVRVVAVRMWVATLMMSSKAMREGKETDRQTDRQTGKRIDRDTQ